MLSSLRQPGNQVPGGKWQHDMFQGSGGVTTRTGGGQGAKLLISNLDYGVSDSDIRVSVCSAYGHTSVCVCVYMHVV